MTAHYSQSGAYVRYYRDSNHWSEYKQLLAAHARLMLDGPTSEYYLSYQKYHLHIDEWQPEGTPKGTAVLIHGGGGNGRILAPFAQVIRDSGWRVIAPDLPGFGLTQSQTSTPLELNDWLEAIDSILKEHEGIKVLFGLSLGGLTAVNAAQRNSCVRGVFATTLLDMSQDSSFIRAARWPSLGRLTLLGFHFIPTILRKLSIPLKIAAPFERMSTIRPLQAYFESQPLIGNRWVNIGFFHSLYRQHLDTITALSNLWLVHPGEDTWTPIELSTDTLHRLTGRKKLITLSNGSHLPLEEPAYSELKAHITAFLEDVTDRTSA